MGWRRAWMLVVGLAAACEESGSEWGEADRLLPLAPEESATLAGRVGASWIFDVKVSSSDVTDEIDASVEEDPEVIDQRIVAVDAIGAEPRTVAEGFYAVGQPPAPGLPWLARQHGIDVPGLWHVDPSGESEPVRLTSVSSTVAWTATGAFVLEGNEDEDERTLLRVWLGEDGEVQQEVVREGVGSIVGSMWEGRLYDRIALVTTDGDLVVRDVDDGEERLVRVGVSWATTFDERARVLFVGMKSGTMFAIDVDDGRELALDPGGAEWVSVLQSVDQVVIGRAEYLGDEGSSIVVVMPDLRRLDLEGRWMVVFREPGEDGRVLLRGPAGLHLLEPGSTTPLPVLANDTLNAIAIDGRITVQEEQPRDPLARYTSWPHRLLVIDDVDAAPQVAFEGPFTSGSLLAPDRWALVEYVDGRGGDVVVLDLATADEARLEGPVLGSARSPDGSRAAVESDAEQTLLYYRDDDDPDINGIWIADVERLLDGEGS